MHSRIFQISKKRISKEEFICEEKYDEIRFVGAIADYVEEVTDESSKKEDVEWLGEVEGITTDPEAMTLMVTSKKDHFKQPYKEFVKQIKKIQKTTFEDFAEDKNDEVGMNIYRIKLAYEEEYTFYVDDDNEKFGLITLDSFVRQAKENKKYYIGAIFDYHN